MRYDNDTLDQGKRRFHITPGGISFPAPTGLGCLEAEDFLERLQLLPGSRDGFLGIAATISLFPGDPCDVADRNGFHILEPIRRNFLVPHGIGHVRFASAVSQKIVPDTAEAIGAIGHWIQMA